MDAQLDRTIREWKRNNPDWEMYLDGDVSIYDPQHVKRRRQQLYEELAALPIAGIQRQLNARNLPHNPYRSHWQEFLISESMTLNQHARGQYLPFHEQLEDHLANAIGTIDSHFGHLPGDFLLGVKDGMEKWFHTFVRKPASEAWAAISGGAKKRAW